MLCKTETCASLVNAIHCTRQVNSVTYSNPNVLLSTSSVGSILSRVVYVGTQQ